MHTYNHQTDRPSWRRQEIHSTTGTNLQFTSAKKTTPKQMKTTKKSNGTTPNTRTRKILTWNPNWNPEKPVLLPLQNYRFHSQPRRFHSQPRPRKHLQSRRLVQTLHRKQKPERNADKLIQTRLFNNSLLNPKRKKNEGPITTWSKTQSNKIGAYFQKWCWLNERASAPPADIILCIAKVSWKNNNICVVNN